MREDAWRTRRYSTALKGLDRSICITDAPIYRPWIDQEDAILASKTAQPSFACPEEHLTVSIADHIPKRPDVLRTTSASSQTQLSSRYQRHIQGIGESFSEIAMAPRGSACFANAPRPRDPASFGRSSPTCTIPAQQPPRQLDASSRPGRVRRDRATCRQKTKPPACMSDPSLMRSLTQSPHLNKQFTARAPSIGLAPDKPWRAVQAYEQAILRVPLP